MRGGRRKGRRGYAGRIELQWQPVLAKIDTSLWRRGRTLCRQGAVTVTAVADGVVRALVNTGAAGMYRVQVPCPCWWRPHAGAVGRWLARRPVALARMMTGVWDEDFLTWAGTAGLRLFPDENTARRMIDEAACTCAHWERPCRHVLAVMAQMVEDMEQRPWQALIYVGLPGDLVLDEVQRWTSRWAAKTVRAQEEPRRRADADGPAPTAATAADGGAETGADTGSPGRAAGLDVSAAGWSGIAGKHTVPDRCPDVIRPNLDEAKLEALAQRYLVR